jgi:hypothetical protein
VVGFKIEITDFITKFDYEHANWSTAGSCGPVWFSSNSSFSRRLAYEFTAVGSGGVRRWSLRLRGLPVRDPELESHVKVQEIRVRRYLE